MRIVVITLYILLGIGVGAHAQPSSFSIEPREYRQLENLSDGDEYRLPLNLPGAGQVTAVVRRFRVCDEKTKYEIVTDSGPVRSTLPSSVHLKGHLESAPGNTKILPGDLKSSHVIISVFRTWAIGRIALNYKSAVADHEGVSNSYIICPVNKSPNSEIVIAPENDMERPESWICGTADGMVDKIRLQKKQSEKPNAGTVQIIKVALECDQPFYADHNKDVDKATEYAQAVVAHASAIYQRDLSASIYLGSLKVWTVTDPYPGTNASTLLYQFMTYWNSNNSNVDRDVAHLFSGINNIGGISNLGTLCSKTEGYAISGLNNNLEYPRTAYGWDTDVFAHELGHNIGSPHTHSCFWDPPIDSCYAAEGGCFPDTNPVLGTIMSYCHLTQFGTELRFHDRVSAYMRELLENWTCIESVPEMTVSTLADTTICSGSTITLFTELSGGQAPYTVTWTPSADMSGSSTLSPLVGPITTTTYIVRVSDAFNTVASDTITVTIIPGLLINLPTSVKACIDNDVTLNASKSGGTAPITYRWRGPQLDTTTNTPNLTTRIIEPSVVYLNAVDSRGCSSADSMIVQVNQPPTSSVSVSDTVICSGEEITIDAIVEGGGKPPYKYKWWANGKVLPSQGATLRDYPDKATTYIVRITDDAGCTTTSTRIVNVISKRFNVTPAVANLGPQSACDNVVDLWLTVLNTGFDTLKIVELQSRSLIVSARDIPLTLAPNKSIALRIDVTISDNEMIDDTIKLIADACGKIGNVVVKGTRSTVAVDPNTLPVVVSTNMECHESEPTPVDLVVKNTSNFDININKISSRIDANARISYEPKSLNRSSSSTLKVLLDVPADRRMVHDTLDVEYSSGNCVSLFSAPIILNVFDNSIEATESVDFGSVNMSTATVLDRDISFKLLVDSIDRITITSVNIGKPYSTTLTPPVDIVRGTTLTEKVFFNPQEVKFLQDIEQAKQGALTYTVNSCPIPDTIQLSVNIVIVSVGEPDADIKQLSGRLSVYDVRGVLLSESMITDQSQWPSFYFPSGVYVYTLQMADNTIITRLLLIP